MKYLCKCGSSDTKDAVFNGMAVVVCDGCQGAYLPHELQAVVEGFGNRRTNPELSSLREERDAMRKILMEIKDDLTCRCDPAYTSRSMHEPNSFCYWIPYIEAALKQKEG